jgi:hypothetical protein
MKNLLHVFFEDPPKTFHGAKDPILILRWCSANSLLGSASQERRVSLSIPARQSTGRPPSTLSYLKLDLKIMWGQPYIDDPARTLLNEQPLLPLSLVGFTLFFSFFFDEVIKLCGVSWPKEI